MEKKCMNLRCRKVFCTESSNQIYCQSKCREKNYRDRNQDKIRIKNSKWKEKNPLKSKEIAEKGMRKFKEKRPGRINELMLESYYRNKPKWASRRMTLYVLKSFNQNEEYLERKCQDCAQKNDLNVHHIEYPLTKKEILEAIVLGKIFYLCRKCHLICHHQAIGTFKKDKGVGKVWKTNKKAETLRGQPKKQKQEQRNVTQ